MIVGLGVDITKISRFLEIKSSAPRLVERLTLSENILEISTQTLAGYFAAMEAFLKALPNEEKSTVQNFRVTYDVKRKPKFIPITPIGSEYLKNHKIYLSISHEGDYAIASVIIESYQNY
jgi:holo-[acyl-carrier-protein] synthase